VSEFKNIGLNTVLGRRSLHKADRLNMQPMAAPLVRKTQWNSKALDKLCINQKAQGQCSSASEPLAVPV
jgi:hypothetical protein